MRSKLNTIIKISGTALFFAAGAVLLVLGLPFSGFKALSVQTGSMEPAIKAGDLVVIKRTPPEQLRKGDVITYAVPGQNMTVTHRIYAVSNQDYGQVFVTKGDANPVVDQPISSVAVLGKVNANVPYIGHFLDFLRSPLGLIIMLYIPALLVIRNELKRLSDYYKSQEPYVAAGTVPKLLRRFGLKSILMPIVLLAAIVAGIFTVKANALLWDTAVLTDSSITSATTQSPPPPPPPPLEPGQGQGQVESSSTTNISIDNHVSQTAISGDVEGPGTSGSVSNTSRTEVNINVNGQATNIQGTINLKIELVNQTDKAIDLTGWKIVIAGKTVDLPQKTVAPGETFTFDYSTTGNLNLSADQIRIKNPQGRVSDLLKVKNVSSNR
jgi:signal peptidase I